MNKYIHTLEKQAFLGSLGIAAGFHALQNLAVKHALKTKGYGQIIADSARAGLEHKPYHNYGLSAAAGVAGKELKEIPEVVNQASHHFSKYLEEQGHMMTKHDHLALRMATQGRFGDLARLHTHIEGSTTGVIKHLGNYLKERHGIDLTPGLSSTNLQGLSKGLRESGAYDHLQDSKLSSLFKPDSGLPLLNNVSHNITRGRPASAGNSRIDQAIETGTSALMGIQEPVGAAINFAKQGLASHTAQKIPVVKKTFDWVNQQIKESVNSSFVSGAKEGGGKIYDRAMQMAKDHGLGGVTDAVGKVYSQAKNTAKTVFVNGMAGELDRTAHAVGKAVGQDSSHTSDNLKALAEHYKRFSS